MSLHIKKTEELNLDFMNVRTLKFLTLLVILSSSLVGAPRQQNMQYELQNLQSELQMVFERIETQENTISVLRQEIENTLTSTKGHSSSLASKVTEMDVATKALSKDIISLRDHFNTTIKEMDKLSKEMEKQSKNIRQMETALRVLVEAISPEKNENIASGLSYKVKPGDSLEKIAKDHGTTTKAIKEINNLKRDTIIVGQNLALP